MESVKVSFSRCMIVIQVDHQTAWTDGLMDRQTDILCA